MNTLEKISQLLHQQNKKQKDLTDFLGLTKNTFTNWKLGTSESYKKYIDKIAEFFGVSTDYLLGVETKNAHSYLKEWDEKATPISKKSTHETLTVYSFEGKNGMGTAEQELDLTKLKPLRKLHDAASKLTPEQIERLADLAKDMK